MEYLVPRGGPAYSRDSRVHPEVISEGSSIEDWYDFLTGTMGKRPTHPDNVVPSTIMDRNSEEDDSDVEDEPEPWFIQWDCENPLPKNAPGYKRREREVFLAEKQRKFDEYTHNRVMDSYNTAVAKWESHPGRMPSSLPTVSIDGRFERDNGFWGMLSPGFIYSRKYNLVLANSEASSAIRAADSVRGYHAPIGNDQRANPRGFPMTIRELGSMVREVRDRQPRWRNNLHLLGEFYRISSSVRLEFRDLTMQTAVT